MPYIKKLVMHGFKSFANRTEIPFENSMNVVVGPNGSGKSNIADSLCFVLGRLSIKSMRAAKAANLLFSGNKVHKPAEEASVELVFDNSDKTFTLDSSEISIKRIVRKNGQSVYKINNEIKTRQELLELLAQGGIDPNGFNIVLQGEIDSLVKSHPEERRKIIEEVAGISIYESRKAKSLKELERADENLKEVNAVLKERNSFLKNLERERQEALNFQKLEETAKRCKSTIFSKKINEKEKEIHHILSLIDEQNKHISKIKQDIEKEEKEKYIIEQKISQINKQLQDSTSREQEALHAELAELKAKIAGAEVRRENFSSRIEESKRRIAERQEKIKIVEKEITEISSSAPELKKQQENLKKQQENFDILERKRRNYYIIKSEISSIENRKQEADRKIIEIKKEKEIIERSINSMFDEIKYASSFEKGASLREKLKKEILSTEELILSLEKENLELIKESAILSQAILKEEKLKQDIVRLDICPLCKSKITIDHINTVITESNEKIQSFSKRGGDNDVKKSAGEQKIRELKQHFSSLRIQLNEVEIDLVKIKNAEDKKEQIKRLAESEERIKSELKAINERHINLKKDFEALKNIESEYDESRIKLQEMSIQNLDVGSETAVKKRDLSRLQAELKASERDLEESSSELKRIEEQLNQDVILTAKKEKEEKELYEKFQNLFNERNSLMDKQKAIETGIIGFQHNIRTHEDKINNLKIEKAKSDAEKDSLKFEFREFEKFEPYSIPFEEVLDKLQKAQQKLQEIGSVNLKSLETYDIVKEQCIQIEEKVNIILKEKDNILKIIEEIDKKKKKAFLSTLESINELFTRNFSRLSRKGQVFLELENPQEPFSAGLSILLKVAKGKYFDVTSLSGGERTLVALSLIFAIQEYKPYCFYIFDEIDAALDKHNSELLAGLIKQYLLSGQYIIVTHNDALISEASVLYGVSMQENISKVISLKLDSQEDIDNIKEMINEKKEDSEK
jgi:chromosome segregation protein